MKYSKALVNPSAFRMEVPLIQLGKLEPVEVRKAWPSEPADFTPWLALDENLSLLGEAVGMELELIEIESSVGSFRLDILAKRAGTEERVVIENQFGWTDHSHFGQLLTYASGVGNDGTGARTIIWIAETFTEPHRAALDWLNKCTEPGISFFGVQIELWKIGESPFAPRFNLVSKPNLWQKELTQATNNPSATGLLYQEFWTEFVRYCTQRDTVMRFPSPPAQTWFPTPIGRSGYGVNLTISKMLKKLECQLWIDGRRVKTTFPQLLAKEKEIHKVLGSDVMFDQMPDRKNCCKIFETRDGDLSNRDEWPELFAWLKERGDAYVSYFTPLVKTLTFDKDL